jgi:hypothetical protein
MYFICYYKGETEQTLKIDIFMKQNNFLNNPQDTTDSFIHQTKNYLHDKDHLQSE